MITEIGYERSRNYVHAFVNVDGESLSGFGKTEEEARGNIVKWCRNSVAVKSKAIDAFEADETHRAKIEGGIIVGLMGQGVIDPGGGCEKATKIVDAIMAGKFPNLTIIY